MAQPRSFLFSLFILLVLAAVPTFAQQASLGGFVHDQAGAPVVNAGVTLLDPATNAAIAVTTNSAGIYTFPIISPGIYTLTIEQNGFKKIVIESLRIDTGAKATRNVDLAVEGVEEVVTVDAGGISVNSTDGAVGTVIDRRFVENLPLNGRSFQSLLTIVPGVTVVPSGGVGTSGGISVNGQRTEANYYTVDGVSVNSGLPATGTPGFGAGFSGSTPAETAMGTTHSLISIDALQEFRSGTSSYSAEYGRSPGGQFSFTSRLGSNGYHGSLFEYFRNDIFDANNFFSNATRTPKPATRQNDFGGTFSGPLPFLNFGEGVPAFRSGKDRTFFFVSYEGLRLRSPQAGVVTYVPSAALRQSAAAAWRPLLNAFPTPNGAVIGSTGLAEFRSGYSNPSSIDSTSVRIDHLFTPKFSIFGRYTDTPSESTTRLLTNLAQTQSNHLRNRGITLGSTFFASSRFSNSFRFNHTWNRSFSVYDTTDFGGAVPYRLTDIAALSGSGNNRINVAFNFGGQPRAAFSLLNQTARQTQFNIVDTANVSFGRHNLKFGIDYRQTESDLQLPPRFMPINVASANEFVTNVMSNFNLVIYTLDALRPVYRNFSAFVQDEFKPTSRLTISLGVRYEVNPAPTDAGDRPPYTIDQIDDLTTTKLAPAGTPLWKTTFNNFAPRFGLAYLLNETAGWETVVRGGGGIFYDLGNTQASDGYGRAGFRVTRRFLNASYPLSQSQIDSIPPPSIAAPYSETILTDDPNLKLPYTVQWSGAVEQMLGSKQSFSISYIGASGRRLLIDRSYLPRSAGNLNFGTAAALLLTTNAGESSYHALQAQFQRRLARGFQANASYTWAHSIDNATSNFTVRQLTRGNSDFDIRHNFQAAFSYNIPGRVKNGPLAALIDNWSLDGRFSARSALPVNLIGSTGSDPATPYLTIEFQPDHIAGQPFYVSDASAPGGRRINPVAFAAAPAGTQGSFGRNVLRGFNAVQTDIALRRDFPVTERFRIQFRAESFNIFNRANFGAIANQVGAANFGLAINTQNAQLGSLNTLYQVGGPRSFQFAVKALF